MGTASWVIPVASLSAICGVGIIFIWWWFPRTWIKGTQEEIKIRDAEKAEREEWLRQREAERQRAVEAGENPVQVETPQQPPKTFTYTPQAYTSY